MQFNEQQRKAIESTARSLLVLAGAGTGKTRTVIGRAAKLVADGVDPRRIAILTFTRRSAAEIKHRLQETAGDKAQVVFAGTFHRFCLRQMSRRREWFGFQDLTVMDRDDQVQLMRLVRAEVVGQKSKAPQAAQLINYYSYARNTNQAPRDYLRKFAEMGEAEIEVVDKIFEGYKKRKQSNSYFDYDDILHRFAGVLKHDKVVSEKVASQFEHVLVDEMQDTNPLQWLILEALAEHANLFCVGDDAQSIYAFRGADFQNVHSFDKRLEDASTLKLEENYRSTTQILDLANWLLSESKLKYNKELRSNRGDGEIPQLREFSDEHEEARWVVSSLIDRYQEGREWATNMVLCRTAFSSRAVEAQLIEEKIPYRFIGGVGLLQMAHVRDLLAPLRLVINHKDELAWMRFLTMWPRIGEVTASRMLGKAMVAETPQQAIEILDSLLSNRPEIQAVLPSILDAAEKPSQAVERAKEHLEPVLSGKYDDWDRRSKDYTLLAELASKHRSLSAFVETYTLDPVSASEAQQDDGDIVTLITVHSAKGTEAEACYVIGAQQGNYPHSRSQGDPDAEEEERRVLYVALTRAKDFLFITRTLGRGYSSYRSFAGSGTYFLEDIPQSLVTAEAFTPFARRFSYDDDVI